MPPGPIREIRDIGVQIRVRSCGFAPVGCQPGAAMPRRRLAPEHLLPDVYPPT